MTVMRRVSLMLAMVILAVCSSACSPTVGDACETSAACGSGLICDLATPGGYCTRTPCRAGECPGESICVDFGTEASWCMRRCDDGQGCRDGLACVNGGTDSGVCLGDIASASCRFCTAQ
ncbi:MAG: hypothetical protein KC502_11595 [Myxococcales bacterium]|nr:hypothetical protein [Myxococcales bacterium]